LRGASVLNCGVRNAAISGSSLLAPTSQFPWHFWHRSALSIVGIALSQQDKRESRCHVHQNRLSQPRSILWAGKRRGDYFLGYDRGNTIFSVNCLKLCCSHWIIKNRWDLVRESRSTDECLNFR
jgi:hypothetical protein